MGVVGALALKAHGPAAGLLADFGPTADKLAEDPGAPFTAHVDELEDLVTRAAEGAHHR